MASKLWPVMLLALVLACGGSDDVADVDASSDNGNGNGEDAGADVPDADPDAPDAGDDESVTCGNTSCSSETECCIRDNQDPACVAPGTCEGDVIECQGPDDCGDDQICCRGADAQTQCTSAGECAAFVCEDDDDCPGTQLQCCPGEFSSSCALSCDDDSE
jgi:hypothetical protein